MPSCTDYSIVPAVVCPPGHVSSLPQHVLFLYPDTASVARPFNWGMRGSTQLSTKVGISSTSVVKVHSVAYESEWGLEGEEKGGETCAGGEEDGSGDCEDFGRC